MTSSYAVVVLRVERIGRGSTLLARATLVVGDGDLETVGPLRVEAADLVAAIAPLLETVSARLTSAGEQTERS